MKVREIQEAYRLDKFIIEQYGEYSQYLVDVIFYFNPKAELLNLKKGTKLLVPSRAEITSIKKIRGYFDLHRS